MNKGVKYQLLLNNFTNIIIKNIAANSINKLDGFNAHSSSNLFYPLKAINQD